MAAETEALPESIDVAEAVALMTNPEPSDTDSADASVPDATPAEVSHEPAVENSAEDGEPSKPVDGSDEGAPDYWTAEDKAAWKQVPEGLRPIITKYEQQRTAFVNEKTREAAQAREEAVRVAQSATGIVEQAAAWWQQNGPAFQQAFADKWSKVDWNKLAGDNPGEWMRLRQERDSEQALLAEANRRGQADRAVAQRRAERDFVEARRSEHEKLAAKLPAFFGPTAAQKTYQELTQFLVTKGIAAERVAALYEAPILELALAAMRFEQAQQQASTVKSSAANSAARTTPTRVAPGPALRAGDRNAEAAGRVGERFRSSGGGSIADAAELIRLSGL